MTFGRGVVILLLAGIWPTLPACVSLPDYPKDWPAVTPVKPGDCPAIEGTFEDKPVAFSRGSQTQGTNSLSAFLLRYKQDRTHLQVDRVHLSSQEAQISVIGYDPDNKEAQRQVLKTEPRCEQLVKVATDSSFDCCPARRSVSRSRVLRRTLSCARISPEMNLYRHFNRAPVPGRTRRRTAGRPHTAPGSRTFQKCACSGSSATARSP